MKTVTLVKDDKKLYMMKTHHKLKSLVFINHNTSCLDSYKVIRTVYMFSTELTHTLPSGTSLYPDTG